MIKSTTKLVLTLVLGCLLASGAKLLAQEPTPLLTQPEAVHIATLQSNDASLKAKMDACRELAVIGTPRAIPALAALLGDDRLSHMARYALEPMSSPRVDEVLRSKLRPPRVGTMSGALNGRLLVGVIHSVGVRRDTRAIPSLTLLLRDTDSDIVTAAAGALGRIGASRAREALMEGWANIPAPGHLRLSEGMLRCAEALSAKGLQEEALAIYDRLRKAEAPHQVRAAALRGAILVRGQEGVALLGQALRSDDFILVAAAARTAMEMPGPAVTQALIGARLRDSPDRRILIDQALGKRGDAKVVRQLFSDARVKSKPVRLAAIRTLAEFEPASAVLLPEYAMRAWTKLLFDEDADVRRVARETFAALASEEVDEEVTRMLVSDDVEPRLLAIELIGRRRNLEAVPALLLVARDEDPRLRPAAIRMVGELGEPDRLKALLELLMLSKEARDLEAAERALIALCGKVEDAASSSGEIGEAWAEASPAQRKVILNVLASIGGGEALDTVRTAVAEADPEVRAEAIRALSNWKTADAAPDLLALAKEAEDPTVRVLGLRGYLNLAGQGELPGDRRLAMCREAAELAGRTEEKRLLIATLQGIGSPGAIALLASWVENKAVSEEACSAVVAVAETLLKGRNAARVASRLVAPLEAVVASAADRELANKAKGLLNSAKSRAR